MEKKFIIPKAFIIELANDDIVTTSGPGQLYGANGDEWQDPADI